MLVIVNYDCQFEQKLLISEMPITEGGQLCGKRLELQRLCFWS